MIAEDLKELKFQWRYVWTNSQDTEDKQHKSLRCFILPPSFQSFLILIKKLVRTNVSVLRGHWQKPSATLWVYSSNLCKHLINENLRPASSHMHELMSGLFSPSEDSVQIPSEDIKPVPNWKLKCYLLKAPGLEPPREIDNGFLTNQKSIIYKGLFFFSY